jgi:hypothetical protein
MHMGGVYSAGAGGTSPSDAARSSSQISAPFRRVLARILSGSSAFLRRNRRER